jgi:hypothetical protein
MDSSGRGTGRPLSKLDGRWLIQIDELPVFVLKLLNQDQPAERALVREFLYWMRRLRQGLRRRKTPMSDPK